MTIQLQNVTKSYTQDIILDELTMKIADGEHIAIVGENGCGKSTLLKIIAGIEHYQEGDLIISKGTKIAYLNQMFDSYEGSVERYLMQTYEDVLQLQKRMQTLEESMMDAEAQTMDRLLQKYGNLQERFDQAGGYQITTFVDQIAHGLQFEALMQKEYETLSGGERARVNLARRLLEKPDVLLLDEPTNHLDFKGIEWLEGFIANCRETVIVVSHDRTFLNHTVAKIYEISFGELVCYHGDYDVYRKEKQERFLRLQQDYEEQQRQIKKIQTSIRQFRQWGHEGDNEKFFKKAKMLEKRLAKMERLKHPKESQRNMHISLVMSDRSSKEVLKLMDLSQCFGTNCLFHDLNLQIQWQDRIAVCGENGSGKSTLIKLMLGTLKPQTGEIQYGNGVHIGYLPQMIAFPDKVTILQYAMSEFVMNEEDTRRYLIRYGFDHIDMMKRLSSLSGGEKTRLKLAEILHHEVNFIIMDEPTNHLDFSSIDIIEQLMQSYQGTLLVVSHDRYFIQSLCHKMWLLEDGTIQEKIL